MSRRRFISTAHGTRTEAFAPLDWALLAGVALMWGSAYLFIEVAIEDLSPTVVTASRLVVGASVLALFPSARSRIDSRDWGQIVLLGIIWVAIPFTLFPIAQQWISSALTGMLNGANPLFAALIATALLRHLPGRTQVAGLSLGFVGVVAISIPALVDSDDSSTALGIALVLVALFGYALALNISVPLTQRYGGPPVMLRMLTVGAIATMPLGLAGIPSSTFTTSSVISVIVLGAGASAAAFVVMGRLASRVGATRASVSVYFIPVVAVVLGVAVLDESVAVISIGGLALVLLGAWLVSREEERVAREEGSEPPLPEGL